MPPALGLYKDQICCGQQEQILFGQKGQSRVAFPNAAEKIISGAGGLINPQTHGDDYAETVWQRKLRNQAKKKKKRGRGI